jgi:hypothetical protein
MWQGRAQSRRRCGRGEPQSQCRCGRGEPQSRRRCGRGEPQSRCRCGGGVPSCTLQWRLVGCTASFFRLNRRCLPCERPSQQSPAGPHTAAMPLRAILGARCSPHAPCRAVPCRAVPGRTLPRARRAESAAVVCFRSAGGPTSAAIALLHVVKSRRRCARESRRRCASPGADVDQAPRRPLALFRSLARDRPCSVGAYRRR